MIDEACGIFVGAYLLGCFSNISIYSLITNFCIFRIIDIFKPFPIRQIETICKAHKNTAAFGIMIDDVAAAIVATFLQIIGLKLLGLA